MLRLNLKPTFFLLKHALIGAAVVIGVMIAWYLFMKTQLGGGEAAPVAIVIALVSFYVGWLASMPWSLNPKLYIEHWPWLLALNGALIGLIVGSVRVLLRRS